MVEDDRMRDEFVGATIGAYKLLSRIGAGGMGEVFLAQDTKLDRRVALKVLTRGAAADAERLQRFHQEARAASSLNHPNILVIHDFGEVDGRPFIVAEFVEGQTVREQLGGGPLGVRETMAIAVQVSGALAAAHARGIVHRDIKPENVMVRPDGYVKVLDFGLAKLIATERPEAESTLRTQAGTLLGTPRYMSPEQARGLEASARSDVWSLGVMLYEMVAGRPPFDGPSVLDVLAAVLRTAPVPLEVHAPHVPRPLNRLIARTLEKEPRERFPSAVEMHVELTAMRAIVDSAAGLEQPATNSTPTSRQRARRSQAAIDSLAVLPFVNGSGDPDSDYFCDGVTESTIASLSMLPKLRVMARSTTFRFKGSDVDPLKVGHELNVRAVLTGRLTQRGERLAIALELVDVGDGSRLWGAKDDSALADIFSLEETIATEVSDKLRLRLTAPERSASSAAGPRAWPPTRRTFVDATAGTGASRRDSARRSSISMKRLPWIQATRCLMPDWPTVMPCSASPNTVPCLPTTRCPKPSGRR